MSSLRQSAKGLKLCWRGLQAFEFEGGDNGHEDGVALGSHGSRGGLGQAGIGLQGFVKDLHLPPFLVGCGDFILVARQVTARQMQNPGATVFVCKDLPNQADRFRNPLEPALHRGVLCKVQFVYADKTLFLPILFTQGHESVVLQCGDERAILARNEIEVLL